ncbi:hypothetical protein [Vulcanisaeta thermophila]|uniref:hypothetical protein n=1 Tax=Vulcanisaeta thermophila TaxID=867917 RepID=UPI001180FB61|nr:hypothetical protein [Vulcanisaeta thermophila]
MRVRLRIVHRNNNVITTSLVNTGFEADTPQLLIPINLARKLNLWERAINEGVIQTYGTVGGPVRLYAVPRSIEVSVVEDDLETRPVTADALISEIEREVLISDYLAGLLGIIIEDAREGLWRLRDDKGNKLRRTYTQQYW